MYRIALAIYSASPSAYEKVRNMKVLRLPHADSVRNLIKKNRVPTGVSSKLGERILKDYHEYLQKGHDPVEHGFIVFDVVKLESKIE